MNKFKLSILIGLFFIYSVFSSNNIDDYYKFSSTRNIDFLSIKTEDNRLTVYYDFEFKNSTNQKEPNLENVFFNCSYEIKYDDGTVVNNRDHILSNRYSNIISFLEIFVRCTPIADEGRIIDFECNFKNDRVYSTDLLGKVYNFLIIQFEECKNNEQNLVINLNDDKLKIEKMLNAIVRKRSEMDKKAEVAYKLSKINKLRGGSDSLGLVSCLIHLSSPLIYVPILNEHPLLRSLTSGDFLETFFLLKYDYAWKYEALKSKGVIPNTKSTTISSGVMTSKSFIFSVVKESFNITTLSSDGSVEEKEYFKYYIVVGGQFTNETIYNIMFKNNNEWYYLSYNVSNSSQLLFSNEQNSNVKFKYFAGTLKTTIITNKSYDFSYAKANFSRYYIPDYGTEIITKITEVK
ncbi:MAG: hypothetical protein QXS41_03365 [Candidatus Woesearchaeota archaeon]